MATAHSRFNRGPVEVKSWKWQKLMGSKVLVFSILLHLFLGMGAAYVVISRMETKRKLTFNAGPPTTNPSKRALEHKVAMGRKKNMMSAPAQAKRITTTGLAKVALPDMPTMPSATDVLPNRMAGLGGAGFGPGFGGAGGGLGGGGGGSGINFFGLRARAKNVVFVVDVSGSMIKGTGKSYQSYEALEREVIKVINGLDISSSFGLVAFAGDVALYKEGLSLARMEEKRRAVLWLKKMSPIIDDKKDATEDIDTEFSHAGTRAGAALEKAFTLRPDVIFFVSDGEPTDRRGDEIIGQVAALQRNLAHPAMVNAVAYLADAGQDFMRSLAAQNKGQFREIRP